MDIGEVNRKSLIECKYIENNNVISCSMFDCCTINSNTKLNGSDDWHLKCNKSYQNVLLLKLKELIFNIN